MTIRFDRPVGASGDVKELEYVSALHQTDQKYVRTDGSIRDEDIQVFLMSRYGIEVSVEEVRDTVLKGMGGGSDDDECIDLMEMVAILLIPTLLKAAQEESDVTLNSKLVLPRPGIIRFVLGMILQDVTGNEEPKELTPELVKSILNAYGETELAKDDKLVRDMVSAAREVSSSSKPSNGSKKDPPTTMLGSKTFARALTYDVCMYDVHNEIRVSSNYDDVFMTHNINDSGVVANKEGGGDDAEMGRIRKEREKYSQEVKHRFTASSIDFVASTYRSKGLTVLLWATFIVTYFAYDYNTASKYADKQNCVPYNYMEKRPWIDNADAISCQVVTELIKWSIIFAIASVFGLLLVGFGSIGNNSQVTWFGPPLIGAVVVFWLSYAPYKYLHYKGDTMLSHKYLKNAALALGMVVCAFHLSHALVLLVPRSIRRMKGFRRLFAAGTLRSEVQVKQAAAYKLTGMVQNARDILRVKDLDGVVDTNFGQGLIAFSKHGHRFREEGGFFWTWTRIFNSELINREGIWFSARLLASNISQYIVSVFVLLAGIALTHTVSENYNLANAQRIIENGLKKAVNIGINPNLINLLSGNVTSVLADYLSGQANSINCSGYAFNQTAFDKACHFVNGTFQCNPNSGINYLCAFINVNSTAAGANTTALLQGYLTASGFDNNEANTAFNAILKQSNNNALASLYPSQKYMVLVPMILATAVAFLVSLYLATVYLPSHTSTTLKLRSGIIPTLRDRNFYRFRKSPDQVTVVTGSMFWGALISSILAGGVVGIVVFAFLWQVTVYVVQRLVAIILGIMTIVVIKLLILATCRCALYKAFYRRRPTSANVSALTLECSNFALSAGFVFLRMTKLLISAAVFVGRIDTPFLADGVGQFGPIQLDSYPYVYLKDILATDAHRHPYIETLGVMYLMKLRYGEHFGKTAGSCWRLLFVYALMPWLNKYRIQARPNLMSHRNLGALQNVKVLLNDGDDDNEDYVDDDVEDDDVKKSNGASKQVAGDALLRKKIAELLKENQELRARLQENELEI